MRIRPIQLNLRLVMHGTGMMAVAAALFLPGLRTPPPPKPHQLRLLEILRRNPDGSITVARRQGFDLDAPPEDRVRVSADGNIRSSTSHLPAGRDGSLRQAIEAAKAAELEYRVTIPRAFANDGTPIY